MPKYFSEFTTSGPAHGMIAWYDITNIGRLPCPRPSSPWSIIGMHWDGKRGWESGSIFKCRVQNVDSICSTSSHISNFKPPRKKNPPNWRSSQHVLIQSDSKSTGQGRVITFLFRESLMGTSTEVMGIGKVLPFRWTKLCKILLEFLQWSSLYLDSWATFLSYIPSRDSMAKT